ncbi:glutathione S-transferase family protein [Pseudomonas sp. BMS12]|uniref:glutathione S-transferase family protein n=1 Tax=Pseudomonas sp. BMS12 TaxID=1796033 RepID=UPI000AFB5AC3|nr:glutathione S-transferase N-terminal domain-containing protein [Pseudomonas sp. BMS12]
MRELFELCGADPQVVFSPYCWRVRLALAYKELDFVSRPIRFSDKALIGFSNQQLVPVLRDGEQVTNDSLAILQYLDATHAQAPAVGDDLAYSRLRLLDSLFAPMRIGLFKHLILRIYAAIADEDRTYFRESRERNLGTTLEAFADEAGGRAQFCQALAPVSSVLGKQPYLDGERPGAADFLLGGLFFWAWSLGSAPWAEDAAASAWFQRLLERCEAQHGAVRRFQPAGA